MKQAVKTKQHKRYRRYSIQNFFWERKNGMETILEEIMAENALKLKESVNTSYSRSGTNVKQDKYKYTIIIRLQKTKSKRKILKQPEIQDRFHSITYSQEASQQKL